ncbi:type II toxin-antitoxin system HipA family toxin [Haloechinothrix salitolerans]|uniref:Type II toxin-antitoxin system HipA family toxin n=1 Tax=Haloechinothrix salitolerans TaxID=926830 RepID=A0ABW2C7H6_9PSEU
MNGATEHLLHVAMNGRVIGDVQRSGKRKMRLRYETPSAGRFTPLSVSMPGPSGRYREAVLAPWLQGLLPDRPEMLRQWRRRFGIADDISPFSLLRHVGEDVAGAAQFVRPDRLQAVLDGPGDLDDLHSVEVAEMLRRAKADLPVSMKEGMSGKFSLAGAQAKIALHRSGRGWSDPSGAVPSTHIVKPSIPGMTDQDLVEAVTLRTATGLGLRAAHCAIEEFDDERGIVVTRYDRIQRSNGKWQRVHQEDMCQALGVWPDRKYESQGGPGAVTIAELIQRTSSKPEDDTRRFAQALVFNWLTCGTDGHARNYSLLLNGEDIRLAPLYDLNSHLAYSDGAGNDLSMAVNGSFHAAAASVDDWARFATRLHVDSDWLRDEITRQSDDLLDAMAGAAKSDDIARYDSPAVARLLTNTEAWLKRVTRS